MEKLNNEKVEETSQVKEVTSTYEYAMEKLSSLITRKKRDGKSTISEIEKRERMLSYIEILGLEKQIAGLKIIHVAGTKGKGSTCAFCEAILRECGFRTGLFTSPHLIDVRERFRLDGLDISEEKFLQYFWEIWNQLKDNIVEGLPMPPLFQFLTLLAFKIFASEKVDVAIIEVGIGGTFDSTNVIKEPVVCGITSLGMDHMEILGDTVGKIASHKAGILKLGVPAFTVPQPSEAMEVLYDRAQKLMVPLKVVTPLDSKVLKDVKLILSGDHQLTNAALAVSLCKSWLKTTGPRQLENADWDETLPHKFLIGLSSAHLSGRAQIVQDDTIKNSSGVNGSYPGGLTFYLDGAHSPESMEACARWFSAVVGENKNLSHLSSCSKDLTPKKIWVNGCIQDSDKQEPYKMSKQILLFNCMDVRDPQILLSRLVNTCTSSGTHFSKAIFVPSMSAYNKVTSGTSTVPLNIPQKDLSWQFNLQRVWERICCGKDVHVLDQNLNTNTSGNVPPCKFLYKDASSCSQGDEYFGSSVFPSLPLTINWLRNCAKENPSSRIQVLVTGSLHLVGDVLRLLKR